ncbi:MAG: hypothetical protein L6R35_006566 [Caloplaca aegaea]|nr:MAG: hypothetical protein L6R35_006566 [Caloplaca aegaea]
MGGEQQPYLGQRTNKCIQELDAVKTRAETAQRSHRTSSTKKLLIEIVSSINDRERSLQEWIADFSQEAQTFDQDDIENAVNGLFDSLEHSIASARDRLDSRLRYRRLYLIGFVTHKRLRLERHLRGDLKAVSDRIGDLRAQKKVLLVRSTEEASRQSKKNELPGGTIQPYTAFVQFFNGLPLDETPDIRSSALQQLWRHFPHWEELDGKVGNAEDPGDGLLYNDAWIAKAKSVLRDLHQAWSANLDPAQFPLPKLPEMVKICVILTGMQQQHLLEDFLENNVVDKDLPIERPVVQEILKNGHGDYASLFCTEQRRMVPRKWDEGQHLEFEEEEPLPLEPGRELNAGSYGAVIVVHDPFSKAQYARKQQHTNVEEHENEAARRHLEVETERLKNLRHRHVVHLVKSYRRGRAYGILLRPAAHTDLERLILRFHENKFDTNRNCRHREWIRPVFMNAFGCLSKGLAYIHGQEIRHRDVKPANILYIDKIDKDPQRLLWADFGLAYDFRETGNSKTKSNKVYSKRYAAPEIIAQRTKPAHVQSANVPSYLDRIVEDGAETIPDAPIESGFQEVADNEHGRKTDIFALGCIFLELLACLFEEKLPMDRNPPRDLPRLPDGGVNLSKEVQMFSQHISELREWIQERQNSSPDNELAPVLGLAARMISRVPKDRPVISEVVQILSSRRFFCDTCWQDHPKEKAAGEPLEAAGPDSPPTSPGASLLKGILNRVNSGPVTGSAENVFKRINSGGLRPQSKRVSSGDTINSRRRYQSLG